MRPGMIIELINASPQEEDGPYSTKLIIKSITEIPASGNMLGATEVECECLLSGSPYAFNAQYDGFIVIPFRNTNLDLI